MWQAKLVSVDYNLGKETGVIELLVEFSHTDTRRTSRKYVVYLDDLQTITLDSLKKDIVIDLARLNKLDQVYTFLSSKIGKTI